jgi:hypothetical protein
VENGSLSSLAKSISLICLLFSHRAKQKFVVCSFAIEETNGSYLFANRLNGCAHLWVKDPNEAFYKVGSVCSLYFSTSLILQQFLSGEQVY